MIRNEEIKEKIKKSADDFMIAIDQKEWSKARAIYNKVLTTCVYLEMDEPEMAEIFGNRPYKGKEEDETEGLFPEALIEKVRWKCIQRCIDREEPIFIKRG